MVPPALDRIEGLAFRSGLVLSSPRTLVAEMPVAFTAGGSTLAVMMATPCDLEDFAVGFCRNEGVIEAPGEIEDIEILSFDDGLEIRLSLVPDAQARSQARRRMMAGPTGCGLCGVESLAEAARAPGRAPEGGRIKARAIAAASRPST